MRTHTGEKPHVCSDCDKRFSRLSNLNPHMMTHTGEKPHVCSDCDKRFSRLATLKIHMMTHTEAMVHMCFDCNKAFSNLVTLNRHMLTHVNLKKHNSLDKQNCDAMDEADTGSEYSNCVTCIEGFILLQEMENHTLAHKLCG